MNITFQEDLNHLRYNNTVFLSTVHLINISRVSDHCHRPLHLAELILIYIRGLGKVIKDRRSEAYKRMSSFHLFSILLNSIKRIIQCNMKSDDEIRKDVIEEI